jgi:hypothetical protein
MAQQAGSPFGSTIDFGGAVSGNAIGWDAGTRTIDMHPELINLSPTATVTMSTLGEVDIESASPEWMRVTLDTINQSNAVAEGADYTYVDENVPVRIQNVVQHQRKTASVTGRAAHDKHFAAMGDLKEQQTQVRLLELKRDMNYTLINSDVALTTDATASTTRGILASLVDAGNTTAVSGPITQTNFKGTLLRGVYDDGFEPTDVYCPPGVQEVIDGFSATNTKFIDVRDKETVDHTNVFDSPYGRVRIHLERSIYITDYSAGATYLGDTFALDRQWWPMGFFRRTWMEEPPRDGDRWRGVIQVEWCLKDLAGTSGYSLTGLGTA